MSSLVRSMESNRLNMRPPLRLCVWDELFSALALFMLTMCTPLALWGLSPVPWMCIFILLKGYRLESLKYRHAKTSDYNMNNVYLSH